jgi:hypothetical protein
MLKTVLLFLAIMISWPAWLFLLWFDWRLATAIFAVMLGYLMIHAASGRV